MLECGRWASGAALLHPPLLRPRASTTSLAKVPAQPPPEQRVPCHLKSSSVLFIIWSLFFPLKPEISKA